MSKVSVQRLYERLEHDSLTGDVWWRKYGRGQGGCLIKPKRLAGYVRSDGYVQIRIDQTLLYRHRIIWAMEYGEWPSLEIDHINGTPGDDRVVNLREVARGDQQRNLKMPATNTSGRVGVCRDKHGRKWIAQIWANGTAKNLGTFDTFEDAVGARERAERQYGYHANHGRVNP